MSNTNLSKEIIDIINQVTEARMPTTDVITLNRAILKVIEDLVGEDSLDPPIGEYNNAEEKGIAAYGANQLRRELREKLQ